MTDLILFSVLAVIIALAVRYLYKAKKSGAVCIGCPAGGCCSCSHDHGGSSGCDCGGTCGCHGDTNG